MLNWRGLFASLLCQLLEFQGPRAIRTSLTTVRGPEDSHRHPCGCLVKGPNISKRHVACVVRAASKRPANPTSLASTRTPNEPAPWGLPFLRPQAG